MNLSQFNDIKTFSNLELSEAIMIREKKLFNLKFKKTTQQLFRSHKIKKTKYCLTKLKTLLMLRFKTLQQINANVINNLES